MSKLVGGAFTLNEGEMSNHPLIKNVEYHNTGTNITTFNRNANLAVVMYNRADGLYEVMLCPWHENLNYQECGASNHNGNYTKIKNQLPLLVTYLNNMGFNNRDRNLYHKDYKKRFESFEEAKSVYEKYEDVVLNTPKFDI